ncbi:hypothetical protein, partial [Streptomyces fagopyri]
RASDALTALRHSRTVTDRAVAKVRANAKSDGTPERTSARFLDRTNPAEGLDGVMQTGPPCTATR